MKVSFLSAATAGRAIASLIAKHDELHWAVAWGSYSRLAKQLIENAGKFRNVTFGIAFSQTDPNLVDALVGIDNSYVATRFSGGTFHPKIYCFKSGDEITAIVGSANFTHGGLGKNREAAVEISGSIHDAVLADLLRYTAECAGFGEPVTQPLADRYRLSCKRAARLPKAPRDPLTSTSGFSDDAVSSGLLATDWAEYSKAIHGTQYHRIDRSLELLRIAQSWLSSVRSFGDLGQPQRKALAGVIGKTEKIGPQLDRDWGWFGSMRGAGDFANRIRENDVFLARAVDSIPQKGEVTRAHYDRFATLFVQAFRNSQRTGGVPTASRLLAMKRPDVFLCISDPNLEQAASRLGFAKSTLRLDNYWDRIVEVVRTADWYNAEKPEGAEGELWEGRAAMLDAILYRP